nr:MAG TPA: hypothetical protein [Caudoviricetes sp.]
MTCLILQLHRCSWQHSRIMQTLYAKIICRPLRIKNSFLKKIETSIVRFQKIMKTIIN